MATDGSGMLLVDQVVSLCDQGLHHSCRQLAEMMVTNSSQLGLSDQPMAHRRLLVAYADSLSADQQYRRALHYYRQGLDMWLTRMQTPSTSTATTPTYAEIKWKMYECHIRLQELQEALDTLNSIPAAQRGVKVLLSLAKLYHHFKHDSNSAMTYYHMVISQSPFALEAITGLLSLGVSLNQVIPLLQQGSHSPMDINWLSVWLKAQACIANHEFTDAASEFNNMNKLGIVLSPETNCQAGWCMAKQWKRTNAVELFKAARARDPFILRRMDTYVRLLVTLKSPAAQRLSEAMICTSKLHPESWLVGAWATLATQKNQPPSSRNNTHQVALRKFASLVDPLGPSNAEGWFFKGSIALAKTLMEDAIICYNEAVKADPSFFEAYENLLKCYQVCRGHRATYGVMKNAIRHIKIPFQQLYLEGLVLASKPETVSKAKSCLEKAVKLNWSFEKASLLLSSVYQKEKEYKKASVLLLEVLDHHQSPALHTDLGHCYTHMKKRDEAFEQFEAALRLDQEFKGASQGLQQLVLDSHPNQEMADREGDLSGEEDGNENMPDEYPVNFRQGLFNDESEDVPIPMMMDYDMDPY